MIGLFMPHWFDYAICDEAGISVLSMSSTTRCGESRASALAMSSRLMRDKLRKFASSWCAKKPRRSLPGIILNAPQYWPRFAPRPEPGGTSQWRAPGV